MIEVDTSEADRVAARAQRYRDAHGGRDALDDAWPVAEAIIDRYLTHLDTRNERYVVSVPPDSEYAREIREEGASARALSPRAVALLADEIAFTAVRSGQVIGDVRTHLFEIRLQLWASRRTFTDPDDNPHPPEYWPAPQGEHVADYRQMLELFRRDFPAWREAARLAQKAFKHLRFECNSHDHFGRFPGYNARVEYQFAHGGVHTMAVADMAASLGLDRIEVADPLRYQGYPIELIATPSYV